MLATLNQAGGTCRPCGGGRFVPAGSRLRRRAGERDHETVRRGVHGELCALQRGRWQGPIESAFGSHLVFEGERTEARVPALAEVRDAVRREWESARRQEANETFYQKLLERTPSRSNPPPVDADARIAAKQ